MNSSFSVFECPFNDVEPPFKDAERTFNVVERNFLLRALLFIRFNGFSYVV